MGRKLFRFIGNKLLRPEWTSVAGLLITMVTSFFSGSQIIKDNPIMFVVIATLMFVVVSQILRQLFLWVSRQFNYLRITPYHSGSFNNSRLISIDFKNDYDDDINDFKVTLHRAWVCKFPVDLIIPYNGSEFNVTEGIKENGRFPGKQPARIYIAQIPNDNHIRTELLIKDGLLNDAMFQVKDYLWLAVYEIVFEVTGKVQDEHISRWYRARFRYAYEEKDRKPYLATLKWMGLKRISKRQHEKMKKVAYSTPLKKEKFDLKTYKDLENMSIM